MVIVVKSNNWHRVFPCCVYCGQEKKCLGDDDDD